MTVKEGCKSSLFFFSLIVLISLLSNGCSIIKQSSLESTDKININNISAGLPSDGLWRQNIVLEDMNNDGWLDIILPPPRKAEEKKNRPFIFLWNKEKGGWHEGNYIFPEKTGYSYGGISACDLNNDGILDIALAMHSSDIKILFRNNDSFSELKLPVDKKCISRILEVVDMNNDGWKDIVALSEFNFSGVADQCGIFIGYNREGKGWETKIIEDSQKQFGDYMAIGDVNGDRIKDIVIAPQCRRDFMKPVWLCYSKGLCKSYEGDLHIKPDEDVYMVRTKDINGDGIDEIVFKVAPLGAKEIGRLVVLKWKENTFQDISKGLETINSEILAFDLEDIDGDNKKEIILLTKDGLNIYKPGENNMDWIYLGKYNIPSKYLAGVFDLKARKDKDGTTLIVFNQGIESNDNNGIRAFRLIWKEK